MRMEMCQELSGCVMKIAREKEYDCFGSEMLKHNKIKGLIGANIHSVDKSPLYIYEIGDRIPLAEYYKDGMCTKEDWKRLMNQLLDVLERGTEYFLSERDILLEPNTLFYDEKEEQLYALYLDGYEGDVAKGIASLLEDFMNYMNHQNRDLTFFIYGLHRIVKENHCSINRLKEYMDEGEIDAQFKEMPQESREGKKGDSVVKAEWGKKSERGEEADQEKTASKLTPERKKENEHRIDTWIIIILGIFILIVAWKSQMLLHPVTKEVDVKKTVFFLGVFLAAEGLALHREWKEILWKNKEVIALLPMDQSQEVIRIKESPCYIGSNAEKASKVIDGWDISPIHVKIVLEEKKVYLIDQESGHGTWKNESRLVPWERNRLQHGDIIRMASAEYKVRIPQMEESPEKKHMSYDG